ncbi:MAG: tetraacyldisaccharide 4'-kinase, partial [Halanaerobiaceae bacterium]
MNTGLRNYILEIIRGNKKGPVSNLIKLKLRLLSYLYGFAVFIRNLMYDKNIFKRGRVDAKTISIGNITTGGTGKTPAVEAIASDLNKLEQDIVIISRGYRGDNEKPLVVSNGDEILAGAKLAGDEAFMLASKLTEIPVIICKDRLKAASYAQEEFKPDFILLDDGFQHRRIIRDYDLVLIDATNPFGYNYLIPRGLLRENKSSLKRADGMVITRADQVSSSKLEEIIEELKDYNDPAYIYLSSHEPSYLQNIAGERFSLDRLNNKNVIAFSGLGNPEAFESSLEKQGCNLIKHYIFSDHHSYRPEDFKEIARRFSKGNLDYLITTGKDLVKIDDAIIDFFRVQGLNLYSLEIKMVFKDQTGQAINIGESL